MLVSGIRRVFGSYTNQTRWNTPLVRLASHPLLFISSRHATTTNRNISSHRERNDFMLVYDLWYSRIQYGEHDESVLTNKVYTIKP